MIPLDCVVGLVVGGGRRPTLILIPVPIRSPRMDRNPRWLSPITSATCPTPDRRPL